MFKLYGLSCGYGCGPSAQYLGITTVHTSILADPQSRLAAVSPAEFGDSDSNLYFKEQTPATILWRVREARHQFPPTDAPT